MNNKVKDIDIKNRIYYFLEKFNIENINLEDFSLNNIKIHKKVISHTKKSHKNIFLFTILDMSRSKSM